MVEHNPPPSSDSTCPPVIPCPLRSMSLVGSFLSSMTEDSSAVDFRSVGRGSFQRRKESPRQPL